MELNHILLFMAIASASIVLLRSWRMRSRAPALCAIAVLVISGVSWLLLRPAAGTIAALAWLSFLFVPTIVRNRILEKKAGVRPFALAISPAVMIIVAANAILFGVEILRGGATDPQTLQRLGELDTDAVQYGHEYWRLFTALFLHYGIVHLLFNLCALVMLGPPLEREIGSIAFVACYLIAGIGSSFSVFALTFLHLSPPLQLVGASGSVMGIVGAWAGILLRDRHAPLAKMRLRNIGLIVLLQVAFDLITPQVSMAAHLGGLVTGFVVALFISVKEPRLWTNQ